MDHAARAIDDRKSLLGDVLRRPPATSTTARRAPNAFWTGNGLQTLEPAATFVRAWEIAG